MDHWLLWFSIAILTIWNAVLSIHIRQLDRRLTYTQIVLSDKGKPE